MVFQLENIYPLLVGVVEVMETCPLATKVCVSTEVPPCELYASEYVEP